MGSNPTGLTCERQRTPLPEALARANTGLPSTAPGTSGRIRRRETRPGRAVILGRVEITALGFRTDVMVRRREGAEVTDADGCLVISSPANPDYWWGNFLLIPPPAPGEVPVLLARFHAAFPAAAHVAIGVDAPVASALDPAEFLAGGFGLEVSEVLVAATLREPPHVNAEARVRPLAGDDDWRQSAELRIACHGQEAAADPAHERFLRRRAATARTLTEAGHGTWFGAFQGARLAAQVGVVGRGDEQVRFQDVETHPLARRQGLAGTLVHRAGCHALGWDRARTLVIVADPAGEAARLYRSVGFTYAQDQLALLRPPPDPT